MKKTIFLALGIALAALWPLPLHAQTYVIRNARIVTVSGPTIPTGDILIRDGKIAAIGSGIRAPANAKVVDAKGLTAYPGLIDAHTSIGLNEIASIDATQDTSEIGDFNPHMKASAAINPLSEHVAVTRTNGVTSALSTPTGGLISGQGALINLDGWVTKDMLLKDSAVMVINYPRELNLAANTTEQQRRDAENNRKKRIESLKKTLRDAQGFARIVDARPADAASNPMLRALVPAVKGEQTVLINVDRAEEIKGALELADEFKLKVILAGCSEAWKVVDLLKAKNVPVLLGGVLSLPSGQSDPYDVNYSTAAVLAKNGVKFAFTTNDAAHVRDLPWLAGVAVAFGLPKEEALKAVTLYPAQILGVDQQIGSLSEGKVANIVLTDGDPLEKLTRVKHVFIAGKPVELKNKQTELYELFSNRP
jgi:imidazolonepropionase-like amidohydrolase